MTIATRLDSSLAATITHQGLYDAIKAAFTIAGTTPIFDQYVSGSDKIVVYEITLDATKTYGKTYLRIRITTALVIAQQIYATWNATAHTGTGNSTEIVYAALVSNSQINFTALSGESEYKLIVLNQAAAVIILGFLSPANKPSWYDLNAWNYCFFPTAATFALFRSTTLNPYGNTENDSNLNSARMGTANSITNRRDLLPGLIIYNQSNRGIVGRSSDDLVSVAASGTTIFDVMQIPGDTKQYLIVSPISGGLAVRFA